MDDREDKTTEIMAQLLLKGWAMLSEVCSECQQVPLMRSRKGELRCCKCSKEDKTEVNNLNVETDKMDICSINKYNLYGEIPLNGKDSINIHEDNDININKLSNISIKNSMKSSYTYDFQSKQLKLLEVQLNKCLQKYIAKLSESIEDDIENIDRDDKLLKIIEILLKNMKSLRELC